MLTILTDLPENVLGAEASGMVTGEDYQNVLAPALEVYLRTHDAARVLVVLGPAFEGFGSGAMWDDAKLGLSHIDSWKKVAVVTDHGHLRVMIKTFAFTMPGEVRTFEYAELPAAREWIAA
jgi:hypothetical protein